MDDNFIHELADAVLRLQRVLNSRRMDDFDIEVMVDRATYRDLKAVNVAGLVYDQKLDTLKVEICGVLFTEKAPKAPRGA